MIEILLTTIYKRPYVFAFLLAYLFLSIRREGLKNSLSFLLTGYLIAWISEASSIRTGFPYGWYFYLYNNMPGEWMNWGVPVWDSVSYVFLTYAGLRVAEFIFPAFQSKLKLALGAAFFTTLMDIIVDPLAHQGSKWFLGEIYYYPNPGYYFNVPLSNFCGWLLVSFCIAYTGILLRNFPSYLPLWKRGTAKAEGNLAGLENPPSPPFSKGGNKDNWINTYGGVALYSGIFLFNLGITFWIRDYLLALCSTLWFLIPALLILNSLKNQKKSAI